MIRIPLRTITVLLVLAVIALASYEVLATEYTFLRTPRCGDGGPDNPQDLSTLHPMCEGAMRRTVLPTAPKPLQIEYTQLAAYDTETGLVRVLIDPGLGNAVVDAVPGLDGRTVFYSLCLGVQRNSLPPTGGCHIERIDSQTLARERLIEGGIHMSPREYQPGKLVYQWHGEGGFRPAGMTEHPGFQLAIYDIATGAGEIIGHQSVGSVLHPFPMMNGAIGFSSLENQGVRTHSAWGLWSQFPDGRHWSPMLSGFPWEAGGSSTTFHFAEQLGNGRIVFARYYENFTGGLGTIYEFAPSERDVGRPVFGSWKSSESTPIVDTCAGAGKFYYRSPPFQPHGLRNVTPFSQNGDFPSCKVSSNPLVWEGKVTHPAPALDNGLLMTLCVGSCQGAGAPAPESDMGIAILPAKPQADGSLILEPALTASDVQWIHNTDEWHEWWPRVLASYEDIYRQPAPEAVAFLPRAPRAKPGDPVGWIGSSSTCVADVITSPRARKDGTTDYPGAWVQQGIDEPYDCDSVVGMRIYAFEPQRQDGDGGRWGQMPGFSEERYWILGEIPIEEDGSWVAMVPADVPIGFAPVNAAGDALVPPATWKKVSPGEERVDCKGCHAHSQQGVEFAGTMADAAEYHPFDVAYQTPLMEAVGTVIRAERAITVEWARDIAEHFLAEGEKPTNDPIWRGVVNQIRKLQPTGTLVPDSFRSPLMQTPKVLALPEPEQRQIRRWIGMGAPTSPQWFHTWHLDEYPPTIAMEVVGDKLYVGAYDMHDVAVVPEVTVEGEALVLTEIEPGRRWVTDAPPAGTLVTARAQDAPHKPPQQREPRSNVRIIKRVMGAAVTEPPTDPPPVDPPACPVCPDCPPPTVCPVPEVPTVTVACPDTVLCELVTP